ncbi:putative trehalose-phosphate phosphatase 6, partial [Drosera capensis]
FFPPLPLSPSPLNTHIHTQHNLFAINSLHRPTNSLIYPPLSSPKFHSNLKSYNKIRIRKMTKRDVMVSNDQSRTTMMTTAAAAVAVAVSRKKQEVVGDLEISTWVESMKASSPTHVKSFVAVAASDDDDDGYSSWMADHPSAVSMFDEIVRASKGKQIAMFLDYDGTLSPIVDDPDLAFMSDAMRRAVRKVAANFPTAIISGRCREKVYDFVRIAGLYYAGSHGMDIKGPAKGSKYMKKGSEAVFFQPPREFISMIDEASVYQKLLERAKPILGANVEHNKFCVSVHFRCVDEMKWSDLADEVRSVLKDYPELRLTQGRKVLEIRPIIKWDKGKALEFLLESLGFADSSGVFPVYIGDDRTDEDAFKVLRDRGQGFGIVVTKTPKQTYASYHLREPAEVMAFLHRLVKWRTQSLRRYKL